MTITIEWLCKHKVCPDGLKWFETTFGHEATPAEVITRAVTDERPNYIGWLLAQDLAVTRAFLAAGADVHADDDNALRWAASGGHAEVVELLLAAGADVHAVNDYALRWAASNGRTETVRLLLAAGADIHANNDLALRWAAYYGHIETVRILIAAGANKQAGIQAIR